MSRARAFTRSEIMDAARAAAEVGLAHRLREDGSIEICDPNAPRHTQYLKIPFPPRESGPYVYFMQCRQYIKIGFAIDVRRRHSDIQGNNADPVKLIHWVTGGAAEEKVMHERFTSHRHMGEWFYLAGNLYEYLEQTIGEGEI